MDELRRRVEDLRLESAVMRDTIRVLKADDPRLDPSVLTNREGTRVVDAIRDEFGLVACLDAVGLKCGTCCYERGAIGAGGRYAGVRVRVTGLFEDGGRMWGCRTIHRLLRLDESDPLSVSEKVVRRIMREEDLRPVCLKRSKRWNSCAGEITRGSREPLGTRFPRRHGESDASRRGRNAQGRGASRDPFRPRLPLPAARMDPHPREPRPDRSMCAKGRGPDNTAAEGFLGRPRNEFYHGRDWRGAGFEELRERLTSYLTHYNETRIKKSPV